MSEPLRPEEEALGVALHDYVKVLAGRPLTPRSLLDLERATKLARQLILLGKADKNGIQSNQLFAEANYQQSAVLMGSNEGYDAPITTSPPAETFGVSVVRELVASVAQLVKPPETTKATSLSCVDLVYAISMAREKGMTELEAKLSEKLLTMADNATDAVESEKANGAPVAPGHVPTLYGEPTEEVQ